MNGLLFVNVIFSPLEGNNACLDPGMGSLILQLILAALLGGCLYYDPIGKRSKMVWI